jgi:hypothetical protein
LRVKKGGFLIMDKVDEISDIIEAHIANNGIDTYYGGKKEICNLETLCVRILLKLGICEKCGAKLKGEDNE